MPADSPVIRFATESDGPQGVWSLVGRKLGHAVPVDPESFAQAFPARFLADHPRSLLHIAEVGGVIAGYALTTINPLLYTNGPSAQLQEIVVDDSHADQWGGYGSWCGPSKSACEERGVTQLTVASRRAGGFYDRLGYTQQAEYMRSDSSPSLTPHLRDMRVTAEKGSSATGSLVLVGAFEFFSLNREHPILKEPAGHSGPQSRVPTVMRPSSLGRTVRGW